ncbi:MAG: hypothetical protein HYT87_13550 [Nitrospirae bacterium]|nr:hypothetical protein [Nitrospirota bacterium]
MTVSADSGLFDPRSYSNWLVVVIIVATAILMLSLRKKAKSKDYLRGDPGKMTARRLMDTTIRKNAFGYRAGAFGAGARPIPLRPRGIGALYARLLEKTRR